MEETHEAHALGLIERLNAKPSEAREDNPFYWYLHLQSLGKRMQTKEIVDEAIRSFDISNDAYTILRFVAKKFLTREVCAAAISKNGMNLKYVPMQYRDLDMCMAAVQNDGRALKDVPKQVLLCERGYELCLIAVGNDFNGGALSVVPVDYLKGEKGKELCETAVRANGYAFEHLPARMKTKEFATLAVEAHFPVKDVIWPDGTHKTYSAYSTYRPILSLIPGDLISQELVAVAVRRHPDNIGCAPSEYVSRSLCLEVIKQDPENVQYFSAFDDDIISYAVSLNPRAILCVPKPCLTFKLCCDALSKDPTIPIKDFPDDIQEKLEKKFKTDPLIKYDPIALETPEYSNEMGQMISVANKTHSYDLAIADGPNEVISYISDIHLEHQIRNIGKLSIPKVRHRIHEKVSELVSSVPDTKGVLLVGGDIADSIELESLFYEQLTAFDGWTGRIISVLGNHELWDGDPLGIRPARPIDEIITSYRQALPYGITLLENELFIEYKGLRSVVLDEQTILDVSIEELTEVCNDSTLLVLGGLGFSGLNPVYNAEFGLYRAAVSTEEDIARSQRFRAVYEKVMSCAANLRVIVLTHTQMADWSNAQYNPKWIYVSGHTHQNTFILQPDGTSVFSDNQVGYKPKRWHLNSFTVDVHRYDPFKSYPNGVHRITREQYVEFNRCQGIMMQGMKNPGDLYALKFDGIYMFVLESTSSLCLLEGGRRHKLDYDISYYYENLPEYIEKVRGAFVPYHKALSMISNEVKEIGGSGTVHGCIVDIDWFNHVYLNPFDGKVTPYFAFDMTNKVVFDDMESLLESSPCPPLLRDGKSMLERFTAMAKEEKLPILSHSIDKGNVLATVPQVILDRSMYEPSRIMRSIQYVFDQNVLRIWNDAVLSINDDDKPHALSGTNNLLSS